MDAAHLLELTCWAGFRLGWDRRNGKVIKNLPRLPGPAQQETESAIFPDSGLRSGRAGEWPNFPAKWP